MEGTSDNSALWATMLNNSNQWANNPFLYFLFLALFGRGGADFFGNGGCGAGRLSEQIQDNHNTDMTMGAVKENAASIAGLADSFKSCCCENRLGTQKAGYENIISNLQQTNDLKSRMDQIANGITQGFSATAYAAAQQTCDLKTNQNENTQRIIDVMNNHWTADLQQRYNDVRLEMSQLRQNQAIISALTPVA